MTKQRLQIGLAALSVAMRRTAFVLVLGIVIGGLLRWPSANAREQRAGGAAAITGQTTTPLADGRVLVAGGATVGGGLAPDLELWDPSAQHVAAAGRLGNARSGQTATLLADGRVAFSGGVDADGQPISPIEMFDPRSGRMAAAA